MARRARTRREVDRDDLALDGGGPGGADEGHAGHVLQLEDRSSKVDLEGLGGRHARVVDGELADVEEAVNRVVGGLRERDGDGDDDARAGGALRLGERD